MLLGRFNLTNHTLVDWRNYCREVCLQAFELAQGAYQMGGRGEVVEIDESLFRGRRKYNRGRMLRGNAMPARRDNNYVHETVNHSDNFVDPNTGANTQ